MGGGNIPEILERQLREGLSPRGRGKPGFCLRCRLRRGSIPAWAGETRAAELAAHRVHGLSPRGRGKLYAMARLRWRRGSIPAWAGETTTPNAPSAAAEVYPRVGGGNRRRGAAAAAAWGLSPRGRGKPRRPGRPRQRLRSIPAWAGETEFRAGWRKMDAVYPRVGGGNIRFLSAAAREGGLSPRGRGKHGSRVEPSEETRSIPAWAGETSRQLRQIGSARVYPRVGGGNLSCPPRRVGYGGLSPRGRGKQRPAEQQHKRGRSIPAWAGETPTLCAAPARAGVYPRVGGGNASRRSRSLAANGLSPRGRGKLYGHHGIGYWARSIPAWAGETLDG